MIEVDERAICATYAGRIRSYGLRHLRDAAAAEDLVQHVLLAVLQALREDRVQDRAQLGAYVLGTCRHAVHDARRGQARDRRLSDELQAIAAAPGPRRWPPIERRRLEACIRALEARARAVVLATFVEDQDADAIATSLEVSPGNVRVIRHRALASLQACVGAADG